MLSLSLKKLVTCGVIRSFNFDWMLEAFWAIIVARFLLVHFEDADSKHRASAIS